MNAPSISARAWRASLVLSFSTLVLLSCSESPKNTAAAERPPVAVEVSRVAPGDVTESIDVTGTLTPKFAGDVKAEYSGTIAEVLVTEWVKVTKGTLLARFDRREPQAILDAATAARLQAAVGATRAQRELERTEKLKGAGLATQQNLDDARSAAEAARAQVRAAAAQEDMARTRLAKTDVRAPMSGVVAARTVNPGDFVENMGAKHPMFRIVDNTLLDLTVSVPSSQIASVSLGQPLTFTADTVPGRTFEGKVSYINPAADEASRTVSVIASVPNPDGALKSGIFVKGSIVTGHRTSVIHVPRSAMLTWDPSARQGILFVVRGDRAERRTVATGVSSGEQIEVVSGVSPGEQVITRGAFDVREGDRVAISGSQGA